MVTILSLFWSRQSASGKPSMRSLAGSERLLDRGEPAGLVERPPRARGRAARFGLGDLLDRSVFDERTGAEAISHGKSPFLSVAAGEGGCEGRDRPRRRLEAHV